MNHSRQNEEKGMSRIGHFCLLILHSGGHMRQFDGVKQRHSRGKTMRGQETTPASNGGVVGGEFTLSCSCFARFGPLLRAASEETQDDSGGGPVIVLMSVRAKRGAVIVDIEQADFPATGRAEIYSATHFKRKRVL